MINALSAARRILALWLPWLPADRLRRSSLCAVPDKRPLVIFAKVGGALRLVHTDRRARELGLFPGLTLADARARLPDLDIAEDNEAADRAMLEKIADWCDRYTPLVGLDGADGLILDITGCAHLFGGEAALRQDLFRRLRRFGFLSRSAIAATPDAARALVRYGAGGICAPGETAKTVGLLPIAALGTDDETVLALRRAGLRTIHDLACRPRAPLAARFGRDLLDRLSCVLGEVDRPVSPRRPLPDLAAERHFSEPVALADQFVGTLGELAEELEHSLETRGEGGRRFEASFFRSDGEVRRISVLSGRPLRNPDVITRLLAGKIEALADPIDPGFGFDLIRLSVSAAEKLPPAQASLDGNADGDEAVSELIDRLSARFGAANVVRFIAEDSHVPERATKVVPAISAGESCRGWLPVHVDGLPQRPISLFDPPELIETLAEVPDNPPVRFRWRRAMREIVYAEGPERIAPEWWREEGGRTRDYFRVEDQEGHRYWIYRDGLYEQGEESPRWFLHGLFA